MTVECDDCARKAVGPVILKAGPWVWAFHRLCIGRWRGSEVKTLGLPRNNPEDVMKEVQG